MFSLVFSSVAPSLAQAREILTPVEVVPVEDSKETGIPVVEILPLPVEEYPINDKPVDIEPIIDEPVLSPEERLETLLEDPPADITYLDKDEKKLANKKLNIDVDNNTGALIYNYPIQIPSGRNNFQTDISLTYNSQDKETHNLFGLGWSVNIPSIEVSTKRGVYYMYSNYDYISSMSGELVPVGAVTPYGNYGARVENGDYLQYEFSSITNAWTATDKQGIVYKFGSSLSSRQDNPEGPSMIYKWMLEEVRDTNDNYIRYEYYKDQGQIYPAKIFYTGHGSTDGIFEIDFIRESRLDDLESYDSRFLVKNNYRISEIQIKVNGSWVKKYNFNYTVGENGSLSILDNIVESGRDETSGQVITLPSDDMSYSQDLESWQGGIDWNFPVGFISDNGYQSFDLGVRMADINGDGLTDIVKGYRDIKEIYINHYPDWSTSTTYSLPDSFISGDNFDDGLRLADVNGDNLVDLIKAVYLQDEVREIRAVYINNGTNWVLDPSWIFPLNFVRHDDSGAGIRSFDLGTRMADINGDGLVDVVLGSNIETNKIYINNGHGWDLETNYTLPTYFVDSDQDAGTRFMDVNSDGLIDIVRGVNAYGAGGGNQHNEVYINNGHGWELNLNYSLPTYFVNFDGSWYTDYGTRLSDINGDGLIDILRDIYPDTSEVYINTGQGWHLNNNYYILSHFLGGSFMIDQGVRLFDINGDGQDDFIRAKEAYPRYVHVSLANKENLETVNNSRGSQINLEYQSATQYIDSPDNLPNPDLPFNIETVKNIVIDDGLGGIATTTYSYSGGDYYYADPYDKKFAGFAEVEKTIGNQKTTTYYHQGNVSDSSQGEYQDSYYKIGKPYRQEIYDNNTNGLLNQNIYKWEETDLGHNNKFVYNSQKASTDFTQSIQSTAVQNEYDFSTGNLLTEHSLGQVQVDTATGEILDQVIGDEKDTNYDYAQNTTKHILAAPKTKIISNTSDSKEQNLYYDNLPLGQIEKVNLTKEDYIEQGVEINRNFNSYGLVSEEISPEGDSTAIVYDSLNLYPSEITNVFNQTTYTEYNLLNGQLATSTAPNGMLTINSFDAFGRLVEVKISDPDNPTTTFIKQEIEYQDPFVFFRYSDDTGWLSPTQTGKYYNQFYNPSNAYASDDIYTTARDFGNGGSSRFQSYEGFNINLPAASEIIGFEVMSEHLVDNTTDVDESIRYYSASNGVWSDPRFLSVSTIDHVDTVGGSDDIWALNPVSSDFINDNFSVNYSGSRLDGGDTTWFLDDIKIKVYYGVNTEIGYKETKDYFDATSYIISREYYDGLYRVVQKKSQTATANQYATVDISYDSQGRVDRQSLPYITSTLEYTTANLSQPAKTYTYDALDRVLSEATPTGVTSYEYDGFKTTITDPNGNIKELTKDAYGNLVEVKEHNDSNIYTTSYDYTLTNKLEKITDSQGNIRNFHYDALDNLDWQDMVHLSSVADPEKIQYTHDKNGNVLTETSFKGDAISYEYDSLNRVLYEKLDNSPVISYAYDQNGDIGQLSFVDYGGGNSKAYDYDILGRLTTATTTIENEVFVMKYDYNLNGDIKEIQYPNAWKVAYSFDSIGQVNGVSLDKGQGPMSIVNNIVYNQNGQMTHLERANGVVSDYTYDPQQNFRLTDLISTQGATTLQDISYTYDNIGNITNITDSSDTDLAKSVDYEYDDFYRLASSTVSYVTHPADNYSREYQYDQVGNMTYNSELGTMNYAFDNPHQLSSYGSRNFSYDDAGNMYLNGGISKFSWDWRNRLKNSYDIATTKNSYYQYDHNNQRFLKYTEDYVFIPPDLEDPPIVGMMSLSMDTSGGTYELRRVKEDKYVDKYFEKDLSDNEKSHLFLGSTRVASLKNNDNPYYYISDHLSSNNIITDNSGNTLELSDYEPYGKINYETGSSENNFKFTGKEIDEENALQYFGARYMDNQTGRFTTVDPATLILHDGQKLKEITRGDLERLLANPQNLNSYAYALNNPVIMKDDTGEFAFLAVVAVAWIAAEVGFSAWDAYDAGNAWFGEDTSSKEKTSSGGFLLVGLALPGGGYGHIDEGVDVLKTVDKTIGKSIDNAVNKIGNTVSDHLTKMDYAGFIRDLSKAPVWSNNLGRNFDHYDEVMSAYKGLQNNVSKLTRYLDNYNLDKKTVDSVNKAIDTAKSHIDRIDNILKSH